MYYDDDNNNKRRVNRTMILLTSYIKCRFLRYIFHANVMPLQKLSKESEKGWKMNGVLSCI